MVDEGKSLDEIKAARPSADFDADYNKGVADDRFLGVIYTDVSKK
jgi:hypothetical protein